MRQTCPFFFLVVSLIACGGGTHLGSSDGGAETGGDGGVRDTVLVTVEDEGDVVAGARVVFHRPDGEVAGVVVTNSAGVAEFKVAPGSLVTVAYPNEMADDAPLLQLLTFTDIDPGDSLRVEIPTQSLWSWPQNPGPIVGSIRVELPAMPGAREFVIRLGCTNVRTNQLVTVVDVPERCLGSDSHVDLTVDALSPPSISARLGTTFASSVLVSADSITEVILPDWIQSLPSMTVQLADIPEGPTNALAVAGMLSDGQAFGPTIADTQALDGTAVTLSPRFISEFSNLMDLEVRLSGVGYQSSVFRLSAPADFDTSFSGDQFLPVVRDVTVDDAATRIAWTSTGDASKADATFLYLRYWRSEGATTRRRIWTITTRPDTASPFVLPKLPSELAGYGPQPDDGGLEPGIVTFDVDWVFGYDQFIAEHGTRFLDDPCVPSYSTAKITRAGAFYGPRLTTASY